MANFSAKILNNSTGALLAQQAVIATTSNNIANVNTPGYTRRTVQLETRVSSSSSSSIDVGNGVDIGAIQRTYDSFVENSLRDAIKEKSGAEVEDEFLQRAQQIFDLTGNYPNIGNTLSDFVSSLKSLQSNPGSVELRAILIQKGNALTQSIQTSYSTISGLQNEADRRLSTEVDAVNNLTTQIATLNVSIQTRESAGQTASDERDKRDVVIQKLAEKIGFDTIESSDGQLSVTLSNGFALVSGSTSRDLEVTSSPSFSTGTLPASLWGGVLSYVVYDYDRSSTTEAHLDLTQKLQAGGGSIGSLLRVRGFADAANTSSFQADGSLVEIASRIEGIARQLLTTINTSYLGSDENVGTGGLEASSGDLDGNTPATYGLFTFPSSVSRDADVDGRPDDLTNALLGIDNYASIITMAISDPRDVAAALDLDPGIVVSTSFAPGDSRNIENLAAVFDQTLTFSAGNYTFSGTFSGAYTEAVTYTGNLKRSAEINRSVAESSQVAAQERRDEISAVSLDEEFARLIQFQKAFEASARMIKVADELLTQIIQLI